MSCKSENQYRVLFLSTFPENGTSKFVQATPYYI